MTEAMISYAFLQHYWWAVISLLAGLLVFLMFVQGGQTLVYTLGKTSIQRSMIVNALGRKWEFTFTTLVTFGGAFFASFPLFYATSFGGAYWVWILILFAFVIQAIAYEFRSKPNNVLGQRTYEVFLFLNGAFGTFLIGVAVATFFTGSAFWVDEMNFSEWKGPAHGLEALLNIQNLSLGLTVFFLSRVLGLLYIQNSVKDHEMESRLKRQLLINGLPFVVFFLFFVVRLMFMEGYAQQSGSEIIVLEKSKYLHNFLQMPLVTVLFLLGTALVLTGLGRGLFTASGKGIWTAGPGTVLTVFALFLIAGYNRTSFYPSSYDLQSSLTIFNASSSYYTLKTMMWVSLVIPGVFLYIWYAWRAINRTRITPEEMENEPHVY